MSGDGGKQLPRAKSKKRRHLCIMDTDSSDDADVSTMKPRRKPRVNKTTSDSNKKDRGKSSDAEVAGSSKSEVDKKPEERTKDVTTSKHTKKEAENSRDSKTRQTSDTSKKLEDRDAVESARVEGEEKGGNSDDQSTEHCPICWVPFKEQEVAVPATCDHSFCLQCILKWTAHSNTCPVDRQTFNIIDVHRIYGGKKMRQMPIETRTLSEVATGDEAVDGDNPFSIFHSNLASSEWDLELSNSELDYDSSVHSYMMFESTNDPEDSPVTEDIEENPSPINNYVDSSTTEDTDCSLMDQTPSDCDIFDLDDLEQQGSSSLSCQNESSPSRGDYSNDVTSDDRSTPPRLIKLLQSSSSDSPDSSISSIDSSSSSPATSSSSTSY